MANPEARDIDTREVVLEAAKSEFLQKGFRGASMRNIAGKVGISAAALYWHFENKEALFDALVEPTVSALQRYGETLEQLDYDVLKTSSNELDAIWNSGFYEFLLDFVYANLSTFRLLITAS